MKKSLKRISISVIVILLIIGGAFLLKNRKEIYIKSVLSRKDYSYLPKEAKEYVKEVYNETGKVLLTEKNKEEDVSYLNPDYVEYLKKGKASKYGHIPEPFAIDHSYKKDEITKKHKNTNSNANELLSRTKYNLRDDGYITNIYDQGEEGICWSFASTTSLESHMALKTNKQQMLTFSEKQIDYATTVEDKAIDIGKNPFITNSAGILGDDLNDGGNMLRFANATSIGISPLLCQGNCSSGVNYNSNHTITDNRYWKYDYSIQSKLSPYEITNIDNPEYSVNEALFFNSLTSDSQSEVDALVNVIKNQIVNNGSLYVGVGAYTNLSIEYTPPSGETALNTNGKNTIFYIPSGWNPNPATNHAVSIIGWDDNYTHNICLDKQSFEIKDARKMANGSYSCLKGTLYTINGAWILQNSWGPSSESAFIYLPYTSMKSTYSSISDVGEVDYDNSYRATSSSNTFSKGNTQEKLNKIKFFVSAYNQTVKIYYKQSTNEIIVKDGNKTATGTLLKTINATYPGIYTADLQSNNIIYDSNESSIKLTFDADYVSYDYYASLHTNNYNNDKYINLDEITTMEEDFLERCETNDNKCISEPHTISTNDNNALMISGTTRGLTSSDDITFKVKNSNNIDVTNNFHFYRNFSVSNYINAFMGYNSNNVSLGTYTIEAYYKSTKYGEIEWNLNSHKNSFQGLGTIYNPYKIYNAQELNKIRNHSDKSFTLESDIDLTNATQTVNGAFYNNGKGWDSIEFSGNFNGNDHVISGLYINTPTSDEPFGAGGLFGTVTGDNNQISNLIIKDASIKNYYAAGALIGKSESNKIDIHDIAVINSSIVAEGEVGGVVGTLYTKGNSDYNVYNLFSNAYVGSSTANYSGGLIGTTGSLGNNYNITISDSVSLGKVNGDVATGGVVSSIAASYYRTQGSNNVTLKKLISVGNNSNKSSTSVGDTFGRLYSSLSQGAESFEPGPYTTLNMNNVNYLNNLYGTKNDLTSHSNLSNNNKVTFENILTNNAINNFDHSSDWTYPTINGITRIPMLKTMVNHFDFTETIDDFSITLDSSHNIKDYISPDAEQAKNIEYTYDSSYLTISSSGVMTPKKTGTTTIHINSLYDGYEDDVEVTIREGINITFNSNNSKNESKIQEVYANESVTLDANTFEYNGHLFNCWNTKADGTGTTYTDQQVIQAGFASDKTLYAQWTPIDYTITVNPNGGTGDPYEWELQYPTNGIVLGTFGYTKTNYTLDSWNTKADGTGISYPSDMNERVDFDTIPFDENYRVTLYAQWKKVEYKVIFYANNHTNTPNKYQTFLFDDVKALDKNTFTYEGHTFINWNTKDDGTGTTYTDEQVTSITKTTQLFAQWEINKEYVTFDANGGTGTMSDQEFEYNVLEKINKNTFTKTDYVFIGWNTETDGSGVSYTDEQSIQITNDITLYAQWRKEKFYITFNANSGTGTMSTQQYSYNVSQKINTNTFTKTGYIFTGWNTEPNGSGTSYTDKQNINLNDDITLYAQWAEYDVSISSTPASVDYGIAYLNFQNDIKRTVKIKNNGNVKVKLSINNPTGSGPFGSLSFDNDHELNPGEEYEATLIAKSGGTYSDTQGTYNGNYEITSTSVDNLRTTQLIIPASITIKKPEQNIAYTTHVESIGWQKYTKNGGMAGTSGRALRLEGIKIKLENPEYGGDVEYRTHIESIGWEKNFKKNDEMSGTSGRALRLEAIEIKLTGEMANHYDIYYRVHAENFGWLGWARNGERAGTAGYAYRLEGIEIKLVEKGTVFAAYGNKYTFADRSKGKTTPIGDDKLVAYTTHVENIGWQDYVTDGKMAGTSGKALRLEGIKIKLVNKQYDGDIEYRTHIENIGWENDFKKNDEMSGTSGRALRLEAIEIKLTKEMENHYDIYYRVHAENFGWLGWARNGERAGTAGYAYRLEGIEIKLVEKGQVFSEYGKIVPFKGK